MATVDLMFDGEPTECLIRETGENEITCYAKDGRFVKFPKIYGEESQFNTFQEAVAAHNAANSDKPDAPVEPVEADAELDAWLGRGIEVVEPVEEQ